MKLEADIWRIAGQVLTDRQFEVLELRYRHDLAVADIAAHLGVTRQAIDQRLQRAAEKIARHQRKAA